MTARSSGVPFFTLSDGERLFYQVDGEGPPLLLVAGLSGLSSFWKVHVPALAERFKLVVHDHRGTGRSSHSRIDYSVEQMAGDLLQLIDGLGIERAHLVGHSTGGAIGQTLAIDRPDRIDRLVLSASWTAADAYFRRLFRVRADQLDHGPAAYLRASALFTRPSWWIREHIAEIEAEEAASLAHFPPVEIMRGRIAAILRFDRRADLARVTAPTLVIGAQDDVVTPPYYSEELGRLIAAAETVVLPQGGHFFPRLFPQEFQRIVIEFLERRAQDDGR